MFQVTFRDVLPAAEIVAQVSAAYAALCAQHPARLQGGCLSVALTHEEEGASAPYRAVIELVHATGSAISVITQAHTPRAALQSGLAVTQAAGQPPTARAKPASRERLDRAEADSAQSDARAPYWWALGA